MVGGGADVIGGVEGEGSRAWSLALAATQWPTHVRRVLIAGAMAARAVGVEGRSVLVHCSDGWDRTAQMTSIAQLLLDPYFRTLRGFECLIEKEWCSFGHKFAHRCGHAASKPSDECSPIFLQFLECVFQMLAQHPCAFEFDATLLDVIADHAYACRFGTFLFDCEAERERHRVKSRTTSLWTFVNAHAGRFMNAFYRCARALFWDV